MIVKVLAAKNSSKELYCQILEGNPDPTMYASRLMIDPYICRQLEESPESLIGRTFDIGAKWTVYTILPRQFTEVVTSQQESPNEN